MEVFTTALNWFLLIALVMLSFSFFKRMKEEKKDGCCGGKGGDCCGGEHGSHGGKGCCNDRK